MLFPVLQLSYMYSTQLSYMYSIIMLLKTILLPLCLQQ